MYRKTFYKTVHLRRQYNCWPLRCSWSIACRRCPNYIFIFDPTPGFTGLGKSNCKAMRETFKFCDLVRYILEVSVYIWCSYHICHALLPTSPNLYHSNGKGVDVMDLLHAFLATNCRLTYTWIGLVKPIWYCIDKSYCYIWYYGCIFLLIQIRVARACMQRNTNTYNMP